MRAKGLPLILSAAALWSTIGVVIQGVGHPFAEAFLQALFVSVGLLISRKSPLRKEFAVLGAIAAPFYETFALASVKAGAALATVLLFTAPGWIYVTTVKKLDRKAISVVLIVVGVYLISDAPAFTPMGGAMGLASGALYAAYVLYLSKLQSKGHSEIHILSSGGFWAILPTVLLLPLGSLSISLIPAGAYLGVVATLLPYTLFLRGVKASSPLFATLASATEPIFTVILSSVLLGTRLAIVQLIGAVLIVSAILVP